MSRHWILVIAVLLVAPSCAQQSNPPKETRPHPFTIFIIGNNPSAGTKGAAWEDHLVRYINSGIARIDDRSLPGSTAATYLSSNTWKKTLSEIKPGDFVLIQFESPVNGPSLSKNELAEPLETLAKLVQSSRATPVLLTPSVANIWRTGRLVVDRGNEEAVLAMARKEGLEAADVTQIEAEALEQAGSTKASTYFMSDPIHTSAAGGKLFAGCVMEALRRAGSPLTLQNPFLLYARFHSMELVTTEALDEFNWKINRKQRDLVAAGIARGDPHFRVVKEGGRGNEVALPKPLSYLSDGDVLVWRDGKRSWVLFFTFRGVLDSFAGFVYSTSGTIPPADAFLGNPIQIIKLAPDWYWYSSAN